MASHYEAIPARRAVDKRFQSRCSFGKSLDRAIKPPCRHKGRLGFLHLRPRNPSTVGGMQTLQNQEFPWSKPIGNTIQSNGVRRAIENEPWRRGVDGTRC